MSNNKQPDRQAVIVIHGIGNQQPMGTLRGFVETYLGWRDIENNQPSPDLEREKIQEVYWSAPDRNSDTVDLRMLIAEGTDGQSPTDYYEYYWAHKMQGTTLWHVFRWFGSLLFKAPFYAGRRLVGIWFGIWFFVGLISLIVRNFFFGRLQTLGIKPSAISSWLSDDPCLVSYNPMINGAFSVLIILILIFFSLLVKDYAGDAARYYRRTPTNITNRHSIISDGVDLLRRLNDSRYYSSIKIVGHSLGSQIAYDICSIAWSYYKKTIDLSKHEDIRDLIDSAMKCNDPKELQTLQHKIWNRYQQTSQVSWKVTDLITLGSPLAHASFLLARNSIDFDYLTYRKELPTCLPVTDKKDKKSKVYYEHDGHSYLHHACQFLLTRWTNIYYPGDAVGGSTATTNGLGAMADNIEVRYQYHDSRLVRWFSTWWPLTHNGYFFTKLNSTYDLKNRWEIEAITELGKSLNK